MLFYPIWTRVLLSTTRYISVHEKVELATVVVFDRGLPFL